MNCITVLLAVSFLQFFEERNQVANFVIAPPAEGAAAVKPELPDLVVRDACEACDGKGFLVLEEPDYGQAKGRIGVAKKVRRNCPLCSGKGRVQAYMNPAELARQVAADRASFAAEHQGRGEIAVGEAFVPGADYAKLDKDRRKLVENAYGYPCRTCNWTGIEACRKCGGNGMTRCTNSDCKGGWAVVKTTTETTVSKTGSRSGSFQTNSGGFRSTSGSRRTNRKETKVTVTPCPECEGSQFIVCPDCAGRRAHPCAKCKGLGTRPKGTL